MFVGRRHSEVEGVLCLVPRKPLTGVMQALLQGFRAFPKDVPEYFRLALAEVNPDHAHVQLCGRTLPLA